MTKQKRPVSRETKPECTMSEIKSLVTLHRKTVQLQVSKGEECFDHDISVVTYNILADFYLQSTLAKGGHKTCSRENVTLNYCKDSPRHKLLLRELQWLDGHIVCLQEVDPYYFENTLKGEMSSLGYRGLFAQKAQCTGRQEGVALFFKIIKFELEEARKIILNEVEAEILQQAKCEEFGEVLILVTLRQKKSNRVLVIGNTHILWEDLLKPVTQVYEVALVTQALHDKVTSLKSQGESVAYFLCGDFNIEPLYPAYELLKEGKLGDEDFLKLQSMDYLKFAAGVKKPNQVLPEQISLLNCVKEHLHNPLRNLQSAYKVVMGSEPECTTFEDDGSIVWTTDYIWFDSENLTVTSALETLPESTIAAYGGFPNEHLPSDHISLKANFKFKFIN